MGEYRQVWLFLPKYLITHIVQEWCDRKAERPHLNSNPLARMAMEGCAMRVQTCENPVTIGYNPSAAVAFFF